MAVAKGVSAHLLMLAYLRARWPMTVLPLVGTRTLAHVPVPAVVEQAAAALSIAELAEIDDMAPPRK